jgi:hypothetical protein
VIGVAIWYALAILYFAVHSRKALVLFSPRGHDVARVQS